MRLVLLGNSTILRLLLDKLGLFYLATLGLRKAGYFIELVGHGALCSSVEPSRAVGLGEQVSW